MRVIVIYCYRVQSYGEERFLWSAFDGNEGEVSKAGGFCFDESWVMELI